MAILRNTFHSRFNGFVQLNAFLSEKNSKRVFPRRFSFPFQKKSNVDKVSGLAYLFFKRSATNLFVTLFAHGKVLYSCSSGIVGLKKKQRRWSNAAFSIGAHFFTFLKHYVSFRSGTNVYRNKPLGNIIVVLRSPVYLFRLFYISFSRSYRHIRSRLKLRRIISYKSAFGDLRRIKLKRRNNSFALGITPLDQFNNGWVSLRTTLSYTRTCSLYYFKNNTSWLLCSKYYRSSTVRIAISNSTFLCSTDVVVPPMSGPTASTSTSLSSYFTSYTSMSSTAVPKMPSFSDIIRPVSMLFLNMPFNTSFFSFLGGAYFRSHKDTNIYFTPDALDIAYNLFVQRYFHTCATFYFSFFFSFCNNIINNIITLSYSAAASSLLSLYYFNMLSTCVIPTMYELPYVSVAMLRYREVLPEWPVLSHNLFVFNVFIYFSSFHSVYHDTLCVILRSCVLYSHTRNDFNIRVDNKYLAAFNKRSLYNTNAIYTTLSYALIRSLRLFSFTTLSRCFFMQFIFEHNINTICFLNDAISYSASIYNVYSTEYCLYNPIAYTNKAVNTELAIILLQTYNKISLCYGRLALRYLKTLFYTKYLTRYSSPFFSAVSVLYNMLNRCVSIKFITVKIKNSKHKYSTKAFLTFQLRTHRLNASAAVMHVLRTVSFFRNSLSIISTYSNNSSSNHFVFKIAPYCKAFRSIWLCGDNTMTSMAYNRSTSIKYIRLFKRILLANLYTKLFTYSFFITAGLYSLSFVYFFRFFFSLFCMRGWADYFTNSLNVYCSSLKKTKKMKQLNSYLRLSLHSELSSWNHSMGFHIFMLIDQSTFPFNGCKVKRRS